jgi:hypothetical protein
MRTFISHGLAAALVACGGLVLSACSGGSGSSVTGPSSAPAMIKGTVDDGSSTGSNGIGGGVTAASRRAGIKITVVETGDSTQTNSKGEFTITVPAGTITLRFQGPGVDARLVIDGLAAGQTLTITVHASGSHADRDGNGGSSDPDPSASPGPRPPPTHDFCFASGAKAEVEGLISSKESDSITVEQQGKGDFRCFVSTSTRIRKGNRSFTLDDLRVGDRVHVSGTGRGPSGDVCEVDASEVKLQ